MKKLLNILLVIILFAGVTSCDDNRFLEENPRTIFTPENAFTSTKQVDDQIVTAYKAVATTYNDVWWIGKGSDLYDGEDYQVGWGADPRAESNYGLWTENKFDNQWNALYQIASYSNLAMKGAEMVTWLSENDKAYAIAQAKFLRGWAYLRLGEMFGGVPIVEEYSEMLKLDYTRTTRDETYQFAIDNFIDAIANLPDNPTEIGRVTKSVAKHFLAEAYLAKGEYSKAITEATDVITSHPLMTKRFGVRANPLDGGSNNGVPNYRPDGDVFYDLFRKGNYDAPENTESIWVAKSANYETFMAYATGRRGWGGPSSYAPTWVVTASAAPVFRDLFWADDYKEEGAGAGPWLGKGVDLDNYPGGSTGPYCGGFSVAQFAPTKYLVYKLWGGNETSEMWNDMRNSELNYSRIHLVIDKNHSLYGQPITEDMIVFKGGDMSDAQIFPMTAKVFNREDLWGFDAAAVSTGVAAIYGRDKYLVRSAETYLLRAEAYLRNGQVGKATDDINAIRERANCAKLFTEDEVDMYTILDERARELSYEEQRWPTLLRIGGDVMKNQLYNHAKYVADQPVYSGTINWELLPIPKDAVINVNTGAKIEQNPGWSD
jgi:tetratricopeptide (TPR) repeat protein